MWSLMVVKCVSEGNPVFLLCGCNHNLQLQLNPLLEFLYIAILKKPVDELLYIHSVKKTLTFLNT